MVKGKLMWAKLKSSFSGAGCKLRKESGKKMSKRLINVNEEYKEVFRTKSYMEMWNQFRVHRPSSSPSSSSSSSPTLPIYTHLSDYLFEAQEQQTTVETMENLKSHKLLVDYFESCIEACDICDILLGCIQETRTNYRRIKRVINLSQRVLESADFADESIYSAVFNELVQYASLKNPLSYVTAVQFGQIHDNNVELLRKLTSERKKIRRRARLNRICKKVGGYSLVVSHTVLLIALVIVAIHGLVGIVAAPGLLACSAFFIRKRLKLFHEGCFNTNLLETHCSQLDLAAKGTYILINDFDTVSRLVRRLSDEIEHRQAVADMCAKSKKVELLKEMVKEICARDMSYLEQLDELEEHIYLCFHTMNRSRRLIVEEIMKIVQDQCSVLFKAGNNR